MIIFPKSAVDWQTFYFHTLEALVLALMLFLMLGGASLYGFWPLVIFLGLLSVLLLSSIVFCFINRSLAKIGFFIVGLALATGFLMPCITRN